MKLTACLRRLWQMMHGIRLPLFLSGLSGVLHVAVSLFFIYVSKQLVDVATHARQGSLSLYTGLLIGSMAVQIALTIVQARIDNRNTVKMQNKLRYNLFDRLMQSRWYGKEHFHSGDILNRMEEDVRVITDTICSSVPSTIVTIIQLGAAFFFLTQLDSRLAFTLLFIMPLFLAASKFYMNRMRHLTKEIRTTDSSVQSHVQENLQHRALIQTLEQGSAMSGRLSSLQDRLYRQVMQRTDFTLFSRVMVSVGFATGYLAAFLWGINGLYERSITFGVMTAFLQLVAQIQRPTVDLTRQIPVFIHVITSIERIAELENIPLEEQGEPMALRSPAGIRFKDISFSYPGGSTEVIKHFSYDFAPRSRTAIVGETGAGKSTLIRLMLALLHPQEGSVSLYNGQKEVEASALTRCNIAFVPQGNSLLSGSIRDNLLLGNPKAGEEELRKALSVAAADFVFDLPEGMDTRCGEQGAGLSEGQAQRIAIARGLLRPGSIVLLDEFSSSLDNETEELLINRLLSKATDKTLIFITHREKITEYCENIIHLERARKSRNT